MRDVVQAPLRLRHSQTLFPSPHEHTAPAARYYIVRLCSATLLGSQNADLVPRTLDHSLRRAMQIVTRLVIFSALHIHTPRTLDNNAQNPSQVPKYIPLFVECGAGRHILPPRTSQPEERRRTSTPRRMTSKPPSVVSVICVPCSRIGDMVPVDRRIVRMSAL